MRAASLELIKGRRSRLWLGVGLLVENRAASLKSYFANLTATDSPGAKIATAYLKRSKEIGQQLVSGGVANSAEDVNGVLMNGFFHLYGPINDYV